MCLSTSVALAVSSMVMMSKVQGLVRKACYYARRSSAFYIALLSVVWRPLVCVLTLLDVLDKLFGLSLL